MLKTSRRLLLEVALQAAEEQADSVGMEAYSEYLAYCERGAEMRAYYHYRDFLGFKTPDDHNAAAEAAAAEHLKKCRALEDDAIALGRRAQEIRHELKFVK